MKTKWIIAIIPFLILVIFTIIGPDSLISGKMIISSSIIAILIGVPLTLIIAIFTYKDFKYRKRVLLLIPIGIFFGFLYPCYIEIHMYFEKRDLEKTIIKDYILSPVSEFEKL